MTKLLEHLINEKKLLSDPARWTKGAFARDKNGVIVDEYSRDAVCWCQNGATLKVVYATIGFNGDLWRETRNLKNNIARTLGFYTAVAFNDNDATTHSDLMDFYDKCIIQAKNMT